MVITTQVTKDYYEKSKPLFNSINKYWNGRFILGCIDFTPENYDGEYFVANLHEIESYIQNWPTNRKFFVSMQSGEFVDYIDCEDDEIIMCIDGDTVMQREITKQELDFIQSKLKTYDILAVYGAWPPTSLKQVLININATGNDHSNEYEVEFTTSFLIAKKSFYTKLKTEYIKLLKNSINNCGHHAYTQYLINKVCNKYNVFYLPPVFQCASWYEGFGAIGSPLAINNDIVLFNHTKYND